MDTIHSPLLIYIWRVLERLHDSPATIYMLHLGMFWAALALLANTLPRSRCLRIVWLLLMGTALPVWVLMAQVGTDAALIASLSLAAACMARAEVSSHRGWVAAALLMLLYAAAMRHNALPALVPLLWLCWPLAWRHPVAARVGVTFVALVAISGALILINSGVANQRAVWPATAMWDLAAISIAEHRVLLPPASVGASMTVEDLDQAFEPWTNTSLFGRTRAGVRRPFLTPEQTGLKQDIASAWWQAVTTYPVAYACHRWRLTRALFGTHHASWPVQLIYFPRQAHVGDNPALPSRRDRWHELWFKWLDQWRRTALLAAWPWLLLGIPAAGLGWQRRRFLHGRLSLALLASGWFLALPLVVVAPAAELRYLGWPITASILALGLAVASRGGRRATQQQPAQVRTPELR